MKSQTINPSILVGYEVEVNYPEFNDLAPVGFSEKVNKNSELWKRMIDVSRIDDCFSLTPSTAPRLPNLSASIHKKLILNTIKSEEISEIRCYNNKEIAQYTNTPPTRHHLFNWVRRISNPVPLSVFKNHVPEPFGTPEGWSRGVDGSAGIEFRFDKPVPVEFSNTSIAEAKLSKLMEHFEIWGYNKFTNAGTHIHLGVDKWVKTIFPNQEGLQLRALYLMLLWFLSWQETIFGLLPSVRNGNQFCARLLQKRFCEKNAPHIAVDIKSFFDTWLENVGHNSGQLVIPDLIASDYASFPEAEGHVNNIFVNSMLKPAAAVLPRGIDDAASMAEHWKNNCPVMQDFSFPLEHNPMIFVSRLSHMIAGKFGNGHPSYPWIYINRRYPTFEFRCFPGTSSVSLHQGYLRLLLGLMGKFDKVIREYPSVLDFNKDWSKKEHPLFHEKCNDLEVLKSVFVKDEAMIDWIDQVSTDPQSAPTVVFNDEKPKHIFSHTHRATTPKFQELVTT